MRDACWAIVLGSLVTVGGLLGPGASQAQAQAALGTGARVSPVRSSAVSSTLVRRYYCYDYRTRSYYYHDVPVAARAPVAVHPTTARVHPRSSYASRRDLAGIGAQGTDGRTSPDEWGR